METNTSKDDVLNNTNNSKDSEEDESFVTKVRTKVSGLFSSSISRLFKNQEKQPGVIRPRPSEDDDISDTQPPRKRAKGMENDSSYSIHYAENNISPSDFMASANESTVEPIAGPSFLSKRSVPKTVTSTPFEALNREKYVPSECTSGYSSMAKFSERPNIAETSVIPERTTQPKDKIFGDRKSLFNASTPETPSRSLFDMTSISPDKNTSLSSRRPSFNTSNFGSPGFVDRTLTTSKILSSPFYNGSTIYGGASAYGRQLGVNETRKQQLKNSFMVKPINKQPESKSFTSLSKTARRILETLEQCSTPMSDVKKVPLPTRTEKQGLFSKYVAANPYQKIAKGANKELLVPSVSERLKMKQIQRLQDTTNEIRHIAASNLNKEEYKISTDNQQKHTNKMKSKITSVRAKAPVINVLDDYILNPVPLMIPENKSQTLKMPDLNLNPLKSNSILKKSEETPVVVNEKKLDDLKDKIITKKSIIITGNNNVERKNDIIKTESVFIEKKEKKETTSHEEYRFSEPLVIARNSNTLKSIMSINNFKFSEPLSKKIKMSENATITETHKMTNGNIGFEKNNVDPLLEKFKAPEGTWECQTCLIRNKAEAAKCAACETPKVTKVDLTKSTGFGVQFAKKSDEWDCSTCLVRNKAESSTCVACTTPKTSKPQINGFDIKPKLCGDWTCDTCWVKNKGDANKCVACETERKDSKSKGGSKQNNYVKKCPTCFSEINETDGKCTKCVKFDFPSHLKPSNDSWECSTCLIRNKTELKVCAACETPNPQNNSKTEVVSKKSDKWECPTCMVRNEAELHKCPCCETAKPGVTLVSKSNVSMFNFGVNKSQFSFGIPKDMQGDSSVVSTTSSLFANNTGGNTSTPPVFKFGIPTETVGKDKDTTEQKAPASQKTLSLESKPENKTESKIVPPNDTEKSDKLQVKPPTTESNENSLPVFKFGASNLKEPSKEQPAAIPMFKFAPPNTVENKKIASPEGVKKTAVTFAVPTPSSQSDSSKPLFSFGSKENAEPANKMAKSSFSFGGNSSIEPKVGFNFNPVKTDVAQQSMPSPVSFGSNATSLMSNPVSLGLNPVQQTQSGANAGNTTLKNGGFNFGSTNSGTSQTAVFSFGATQKPAETTSLTTGGFNFSSAVKPTGGFNFSAPAPSSDVGPKPTFNFTGGSIPTFTANPNEAGGGPAPVRKFKRAVRRTQR